MTRNTPEPASDGSSGGSSGGDGMTVEAACVPLSEALPALTELIRRQSIGRGQIVTDQLHAAAGVGETPLVTIVARTRAVAAGEPLAMVVAVVQPAVSTATILVSGPTEAIRSIGPGSDRRVARVLQQELDRVLRGHGVTFVQWATDPIVDGSDPNGVGGTDSDLTSSWAAGIGLRWMGNLGYWSVDFGMTGMRPGGQTGRQLGSGDLAKGGSFCDSENAKESDEGCALRLVPVDWSSGDPLERLIPVVERTYEGTLDCPDLCRFRTAREIVDGYCHAPAFDPEAWFLAVEPAGTDSRQGTDSRRGMGECVGVVIGARHAGSSTGAGSRFVAELVYMGVVPEARGRGIGRRLVDRALRGHAAAGAERVILAVDEANGPAQKLYLESGFRPLFRESVFAKGLSPVVE